MEVSRVQMLVLLLIALDLPGCNAYGPQPQNDARKITLASSSRSPQPSSIPISAGSNRTATWRSAPTPTGIPQTRFDGPVGV